MTTFADRTLEEQIAQWRVYARRRETLHAQDVEELEGHLRDQLAALTANGLSGDEAFLIAVKRMGNLDALSREFARAHSERLWKQLVMPSDAHDGTADRPRDDALLAIGLAVAAGTAVKLPGLFGLTFSEENAFFYARNASLFVLPVLAIYFLWKRGWDLVKGLVLALPFVGGAALANGHLTSH